jgi:hypothetical protein
MSFTPQADRLLVKLARSIAVEVELPQDEFDAERNSFCNIGRVAEVQFQRPQVETRFLPIIS